MTGPSRRMLVCLRLIRDHITEHGWPPTLRELGAKMNIGSTNGVNDHLRALERKGLLERAPMQSRALRLTELGKRCLDDGIPYARMP